MFVVGPAGSSRANFWFVIIEHEQMIHTNILLFMKKTDGVNKVARPKKCVWERNEANMIFKWTFGPGWKTCQREAFVDLHMKTRRQLKKQTNVQLWCGGNTVIEVWWASNEGTEVTLGGREEGDYLLWRRVYTS